MDLKLKDAILPIKKLFSAYLYGTYEKSNHCAGFSYTRIPDQDKLE